MSGDRCPLRGPMSSILGGGVARTFPGGFDIPMVARKGARSTARHLREARPWP